MASFEDLLDVVQHETHYENIHDALLKAVKDKPIHASLCQKIQPFLAHVNDGGNLLALYSQLQNPFENNELRYKTLVYNVVHQCKSNYKLKKVLEVILSVKM